jgi:transposase
VIDKASIHRSNRLEDKLEEWKEKRLTIFFFPTYSPELNLMEIFLFYQSSRAYIEAYESWESLVLAVPTK